VPQEVDGFLIMPSAELGPQRIRGSADCIGRSSWAAIEWCEVGEESWQADIRECARAAEAEGETFVLQNGF